jgi:hypothetical protein
MRKLSVLLVMFAITLFSCGDGDVIEFELDFDQDLELCGDINSENYLVYDVKTDPNESLILLFPGTTANDLIFYPQESPTEGSITINGSSNRFNYRLYNGDPLEIICQDIPSSEVSVTTDYESSGGSINYVTTFVDDEGTRTVTTIFTVSNTDIEVLTLDSFSIGTFTHSYTIED